MEVLQPFVSAFEPAKADLLSTGPFVNHASIGPYLQPAKTGDQYDLAIQFGVEQLCAAFGPQIFPMPNLVRTVVYANQHLPAHVFDFRRSIRRGPVPYAGPCEMGVILPASPNGKHYVFAYLAKSDPCTICIVDGAYEKIGSFLLWQLVLLFFPRSDKTLAHVNDDAEMFVQHVATTEQEGRTCGYRALASMYIWAMAKAGKQQPRFTSVNQNAIDAMKTLLNNGEKYPDLTAKELARDFIHGKQLFPLEEKQTTAAVLPRRFDRVHLSGKEVQRQYGVAVGLSAYAYCMLSAGAHVPPGQLRLLSAFQRFAASRSAEAAARMIVVEDDREAMVPADGNRQQPSGEEAGATLRCGEAEAPRGNVHAELRRVASTRAAANGWCMAGGSTPVSGTTHGRVGAIGSLAASIANDDHGDAAPPQVQSVGAAMTASGWTPSQLSTAAAVAVTGAAEQRASALPPASVLADAEAAQRTGATATVAVGSSSAAKLLTMGTSADSNQDAAVASAQSDVHAALHPVPPPTTGVAAPGEPVGPPLKRSGGAALGVGDGRVAATDVTAAGGLRDAGASVAADEDVALTERRSSEKSLAEVGKPDSSCAEHEALTAAADSPPKKRRAIKRRGATSSDKGGDVICESRNGGGTGGGSQVGVAQQTAVGSDSGTRMAAHAAAVAGGPATARSLGYKRQPKKPDLFSP